MPGLPLAALSFALPATTGLLLVARCPGGATALARRIADVGRVRSWQCGFALMLTSPATFATAYGIAVARGADLGSARIDVALMLALFAAFLISALCEELGWTGYLLDPLNSQWGPWRAAIAIGAIWAVWHIVQLIEQGRSALWIVAWAALDRQRADGHGLALRAEWPQSRGHGHLSRCVEHGWQSYPVRGSQFRPSTLGDNHRHPRDLPLGDRHGSR